MTRWIRVLGALAVAAAVFAGSAASVSSSQAQDKLAVITVKISGLKGKDGVALITLFDSEETWLKIPKATQVVKTAITGAEMTVQFKGVRPGTYGVSVVHDANKNSEMDMRWFPWPQPKEGAAASNDPVAKAGPPKWDGAKFTVTAEDLVVKATMKYFD